MPTADPPPLSDPPSLVSTPLSILAGTSSGVTKLALGFPLDTAKVLLQTAPKGTYASRFTTLDCLRRTTLDHGVRGLYRGGSVPAVGWVVTDGVLLGVLWQIRYSLFDKGKGRCTESDPHWDGCNFDEGADRRLSLSGHFLAGAMAGAAVTLIAHPIDAIKSKLQHQLSPRTSPQARHLHLHPILRVWPSPHMCESHHLPSHLFHPSLAASASQREFHTQPSWTKGAPAAIAHGGGGGGGSCHATTLPPFKSPVECALRLARDRALYRGVGWTLMIRSGMGALFFSYELILRSLEPTPLPKSAKILLSGSFSSLFFWALLLPADNIKARILTDSHLRPRYANSAVVIRSIWAEHRSLKGFWRGAGAVGLRAGGVNGVALLVWEGAMKALGERTLS